MFALAKCCASLEEALVTYAVEVDDQPGIYIELPAS
jgi:hypothetical protein